MRLWSPRKYWQRQADAVLTQASPVSGTKYPLLNTSSIVKIIAVFAKVTWTVQPDPIEIHITVNGVLYTYAFTNPVSTQHYRPYWSFRTALLNKLVAADDAGSDASFGALPFIDENVGCVIEVETTGGTVSSLDAILKYAKKV